MPKLKSGRHVGFSINPYLELLASGSEAQQYFAIVALRLNAATLDSLRGHLVVAYFRGPPPEGPAYNSGYCLLDVWEGRSDLSPAEVAELREFLTSNPDVEPWLAEQFADLNIAIERNLVWTSDLMENGEASDSLDARTFQRAAIQRAALGPTAMEELRRACRYTI